MTALDHIDNIIDSFLTQYTLMCDECKHSRTVGGGSKGYFAEFLYQEGWRSIIDDGCHKTYCPNCAIKKVPNEPSNDN